jgi:L-threonylcarbamoyladenylate synthase
MIIPVDEASLNSAAEAIRRGELVAFPTETVYGLGANALDDRAVARVFEAKGRPIFNPLIVHVGSADEAAALGSFNAMARNLARAFWPGPLTLVVSRAPGCPVSLLASAGLQSLALRVPAHPVAARLIEAAGCPIVAPSANPSGRLSPTTAQDVMAGLGGRVDLVLDGGQCRLGLESTIVSCLSEIPELLRPGAVTREDIEHVTGRPLTTGRPAGRPSAPGQLASHYAPRAALRLNAAKAEPGEALLAFGAVVAPHEGPTRNLSPSGDLNEAAANLFRMLNELDQTGVAAIAVMPVPAHGLGEAINDRLERAAAPRVNAPD